MKQQKVIHNKQTTKFSKHVTILKSCFCLCRIGIIKRHKFYINFYFNLLQHIFQNKTKIRLQKYMQQKW